LVVPVKSLNEVDIQTLGAEARFHETFAPDGVNVNFAAVANDGSLLVRTYERGVEGETMACGTGMSAVALVFAALGQATPPVPVIPISGELLRVHFEHDNNQFSNVVIEGPAQVLFTGQIDVATLA
jgi:diaminopimelate epimerase